MKISIVTLLALTVASLPSFGQRTGGPGSPGGGAPPIALGSEVAEVVAFDAKGKKFPLRQKLKGRHAVIVFGCLT